MNAIRNLLFALCVLTLWACDSGDIYPQTHVYNQNGRTVVLTGKVTGLDDWSAKYSLRIASFNDEDDSPILSKLISTDENGNVDLVLSGISNDATKVEVCVLDRLRHRVFTLKQLDITNVSDTAYIQLDNLSASMFNLLQTEVFDIRCISCHRNSANPSGQLNLTTGKSYAALVGKPSYKFADRMLVEPYDGQNSVLYQLMVENLQDWRMPHADIIKEENIKTFIKDWIDNGAKE